MTWMILYRPSPPSSGWRQAVERDIVEARRVAFWVVEWVGFCYRLNYCLMGLMNYITG